MYLNFCCPSNTNELEVHLKTYKNNNSIINYEQLSESHNNIKYFLALRQKH